MLYPNQMLSGKGCMAFTCLFETNGLNGADAVNQQQGN